MTTPNPHAPPPPARNSIQIALICALPLEADAVAALFDHHWDNNDNNNRTYPKSPNDPNAYSTGAIGRHHVVLAHMPGMGKASAATVAAHCRVSFPGVRLAVVVGVCGVVPFRSGPGGEEEEIVLGDVIVSEGVVQYDLGKRRPEEFTTKDALLTLGRPSVEIRGLLAKLKGLRGREMMRERMEGYLEVLKGSAKLGATYPGAAQDRLFEAGYRHLNDGLSCEECACDRGKLVSRARLEEGDGLPAVHFGVIASGDTVMMSAEHRDAVARQAGVIAFEMEGVGVWDSFPCLVIKGACDYADTHKSKGWQRYAAATAAACMKAVLDNWEPSLPEILSPPEQPAGPWFLVPYPRNENFVGRTAVLRQLQELSLRSASQARVALHGLGGIGKTQIALEYAYWLREACPDISVFWVHASNADRFRQAYTSIAQKCGVPGHDDPKADVFTLVKEWLESKDCRSWVMVIDNGDDTQLFFGQQGESENNSSSNHEGNLGRYIPECPRGTILVTTRNKQAGSRLTKGKRPIEVGKMDDDETNQLLCAWFDDADAASDDYLALSSRLEHLPLALAQAAAFIQENSLTICDYLRLLDKSERHLIDLLSEDFETDGRDSESSRAVAETWILSFDKIQQQNKLASELLSLMSLFDRQAIPFVFLSNYIEGQDGQEVNEIEFTKSLGILKSFSFITQNRDNGFDMHRLVQLVTRKWLVKRGNIRRFAEEAVRVVGEAYPDGDHEHRIICSALMPHVYAVLKQKGSGSDDEILARASLLHCTSRFLLNQGRWKEAEALELQVVEARKRVLREEHPDTLVSIGNLAAAYRGQGRWKEAEPLELQVVATTKRVLGEEHPDTLISIGSLAITYQRQGRWKEAEALELQVVEAMKRVVGEEHPDTLVSIGNLAAMYRSQGRWKEAEALELQVVEARKRVLGEEHPNTLSSIGALAATYWSQGRWKEAESLEISVLKVSMRVLGEEHPDTLTSMYNLSETWKSQGRFNDALEMMQKCLHLQQRVLGPGHPDTADTLPTLINWRDEREEANHLSPLSSADGRGGSGADDGNGVSKRAERSSSVDGGPRISIGAAKNDSGAETKGEVQVEVRDDEAARKSKVVDTMAIRLRRVKGLFKQKAPR